MSRQDTDLVLEGYEEGTDPKYSDRIQDQIDDRKATTGAANSLADQIIINNIEEEEDEGMDQDTEKGTTTQIEYAPKKDVPYTMSKSLSTVSSNIGAVEFENLMIWDMRDEMFYHSQLLIELFVAGSSSAVSGDGIPGIKNLHIWSIVYQEYKYDWSEHMARDERFHPAIMVMIFMTINYIITVIYLF